MIHHEKQYIGICSIVDILNYIIAEVNAQNRLHRLHHQIYLVIGSTNESLSLWTEPRNKGIYFVMERFCKGVHHALIYDEIDNTYPVKMLSQMDLIGFIEENISYIPRIEAAWNESSAPINTTNLVSITESMVIKEVVEILSISKVRAIPVVDALGRLVATVSTSDFRGLQPALFLEYYASSTVSEFLRISSDVRSQISIFKGQNTRLGVQLMLFHRVVSMFRLFDI